MTSQESELSRIRLWALYALTGYLSLHAIWGKLVFGPYSFVWFRVLWLVAFFLLSLVFVGSAKMKALLPPRRYSAVAMVSIVLVLIAARWLSFRLYFSPSADLSLAVFFDQCVIPPFNEELVFRVVVLSLLWRAGGAIVAVPLSAIVFCAVHPSLQGYNAESYVFQGFLYGIAWLRTGSYSFIVFLHALWNFFGIVGI